MKGIIKGITMLTLIVASTSGFAASPTKLVETRPIPGGAVEHIENTTTDKMVDYEYTLKFNNHLFRAYNIFPLGQSRVLQEGPAISADGKNILTDIDNLPAFNSVLSGSGKYYMLLTGDEGGSGGARPVAWIVDATGSDVTVSPKLSDCFSPKGSIEDGGYILRCAKHGNVAAAVHIYRDASFR